MLTNLNFADIDNPEISDCRRWMVLYTKSRREKMVAYFCNNMGLKHYLPLEKRIKIYEKKKVQTQLPLFPGYLFCLADTKERYQLLLTHQVAKVFKVPNQSELLVDIKKIFIAESADMNLMPCELDLEGKKAKIEIGPMSGVEGIISRIKGHDRVILNVNFLKRAAAVEVPRSDVTLLN